MASTIVRGFNGMPTLEDISAIEGVIIVDNEPPGGLGGTPSQYGCVVGEFADMSQSFTVDSTGQVVANYRPEVVLNASDQIEKFGGFDSTLGQFGNAMGNGYVATAGKVYGTARLYCLPVLLASQYAGRMWRQLPTNRSATDPTPIAPLVPGLVSASYEFKSGSNRVRSAVRKVFTGDQYYSNGTDGAVTNTGTPAGTQSFTAASGDFLGATIPSRKVYKGDMLVLGQLNALGALGANAATYRVYSVTNGTTLVVELLDGVNFDWTTGTGLPWRMHPGASADTGGRPATSTSDGYRLSEAAGYNVAARPLDATILAATTVNPGVAPPTPSATVWDPLSGLKFRTHPSQPLTYTAAIQAPNAANSASIDALYQNALDGLLGDKSPASLIAGVVCARKSQTIALATVQHCMNSFAGGHPRVAFVSPPLSVLTAAAATASTYPGVEPLRNKRCEYYWPPVKTLAIQAAVGTSIATPTGGTTSDGQLDVPMDEYRLALFTRLPPEESPAEGIEPVPSTFVTIVDYARGVVAPDNATLTFLKSRGVAAVKIDTPPAQIQSAVNTLLPRTALDPLVWSARQVFADYAMRSLAAIAQKYKSVLATGAQLDSLISDLENFGISLGKPGSGVTPQRIRGYLVTKISTPQEEDLGVFKFKVDIKMIPPMDFIVISVTAGPTVQITQET